MTEEIIFEAVGLTKVYRMGEGSRFTHLRGVDLAL